MQTSNMKFRLWNMMLVLALMLGSFAIAPAPVQAQEGRNQVFLPAVIGEVSTTDVPAIPNGPFEEAGPLPEYSEQNDQEGMLEGASQRPICLGRNSSTIDQQIIPNVVVELDSCNSDKFIRLLAKPVQDIASQCNLLLKNAIKNRIARELLCHIVKNGPTVTGMEKAEIANRKARGIKFKAEIWAGGGLATCGAGCIKWAYPQCVPFHDVLASSPYFDEVGYLYCAGITKGTSTTHFSPNKHVTRGEFVTFIWRHAGKPIVPPSSFVDKPANLEFRRAIDWAAHTGITKGIGNNRFGPSYTLTHRQALTFLWRYTSYRQRGYVPYSNLWYQAALYWANASNIRSLGTLDSTTSRGHMSIYLYKMNRYLNP